jgi:hypothetical protein
MRKRTPLLEWQIVEKHDEWEAALRSLAVDSTASVPVVHHHPYRRYVIGGLLALLLLVASAGGWLWQTAQVGLEQIGGELSGAVQIELTSLPTPPAVTWASSSTAIAWGRQLEREQHTLHTLLSADVPVDQLVTDVNTINLLGDLAVVKFVTTAEDGTQVHQQTRFYRHTAEGWHRTMPEAELWGAPRRLESEYFIFDFRQNDAQVIAAVAPQVDALYTELQHNFGLLPNAEKLVIEVTVEHVTGAVLTPQWEREPLVVPSPALYFAPVELNDSTLLAQSIAIPLIDYMAERAGEEYSMPFHGRPLLGSISLWQLWELEMPLAQWRQEIVRWLYDDTTTNDSEKESVLPDHYDELCAMHSLWMLSPVLVGIPIECMTLDRGVWVATKWLHHVSTTHLERLQRPLDDYQYDFDGENYLSRSTSVVAVATLVEYAVTAYGHERLPALLAGAAQHESWETLIPAVYGVSPAEFEEGWQTYMAAEYGIQP